MFLLARITTRTTTAAITCRRRSCGASITTFISTIKLSRERSCAFKRGEPSSLIPLVPIVPLASLGPTSSLSSTTQSKSTSTSSTITRRTAKKDDLIDLLQKNSNREPIITSTKSKTVKLYQSISSKAKARSEHQMTLIEGHRLIIDTLRDAKSRELYRDVLVSYEAIQHPKLGDALAGELIQLMRGSSGGRCRVRLAEQNVVNAACDTVTPQGVVALVDIPAPYEHEHQFTAVESQHQQPDPETKKKNSKFYLLLDGISDPGNVGTLIRSAKATGVEAIILLPNSCDVFSPKALRSAMGTTFQVPIRSVKSWDNCLDMMSSFGVEGEDIYAATMEGSEERNYESKPHYDIDWHNCNGSSKSSGKALIIGKEGTGLSKQVREAFSRGNIRTVHVPMEPGIESLNAAVCGSVVMFEYHRQGLTKK
eukprot:CAMPEP_0203665190 /NCGR_PEP_ID=MMETSP0090-20130426/2446_1 /ASSEMBLY_ACC=CAM_ASM_001088 /TAXON_ID=426623 /ORGANISM="Chaetoceros affinis, Strain CCMP159" /LENGTH=423 /DNA_ID=CAMNT_0050528663 /DNA_START=1 /DNA_END=1272 /DNA_ORIENTATION=+